MTRPFAMGDWYWLVEGEPDVYSSRIDAFVPRTDASYLAFLADGNAPVRASAENLRLGLSGFSLPYLGQSVPPIETVRPYVAASRARLTAGQQTVLAGSPLAIAWTAGLDPLDMNDPQGLNPEHIVIPDGQGGWYRFVLGARWLESGANAGYRALGLYRGLGGSPEDLGTMHIGAADAGNTAFGFSEYALLGPGDTLRAFAQTGAAEPLDLVARLTLVREE